MGDGKWKLPPISHYLLAEFAVIQRSTAIIQEDGHLEGVEILPPMKSKPASGVKYSVLPRNAATIAVIRFI